MFFIFLKNNQSVQLFLMFLLCEIRVKSSKCFFFKFYCFFQLVKIGYVMLMSFIYKNCNFPLNYIMVDFLLKTYVLVYKSQNFPIFCFSCNWFKVTIFFWGTYYQFSGRHKKTTATVEISVGVKFFSRWSSYYFHLCV